MFHSLLLSSRKEKSALETDLRTLIKKAENVSELLRCTPVSRVFSAKGNKYWSRFTDAINASGMQRGRSWENSLKVCACVPFCTLVMISVEGRTERGKPLEQRQAEKLAELLKVANIEWYIK